MPRKRRSFGYVRRLPSGRVQASYTAPDGQRRTAPDTFPTEKAADEWLSAVRADLARGDWRDPDLGRQTLRTYALDWLAARDIRPRTLETYSARLDKQILPVLGDVPLNQISPAEVRRWHAAMDATPTVKAQAYRVLRAVLNTAVEDVAIRSNPCRIAKASSVTVTERQPPTLPEVAAIIEALPDRWRVMAAVAAYGGLRLGELGGLERADIGLEPLLAVAVRRNVQQIGKMWVTAEPKTAAGLRRVVLPEILRGDLEEHLDRYVADRPDARVFATASGTPIQRSNWSRTFLRAARQALGRDDVGFHAHDLRHAAAVLAAQSGATTKEVMHRLGHSSPRAALIYQHAAEERDAQIAEALGSAVAAGKAHLRAV